MTTITDLGAYVEIVIDSRSLKLPKNQYHVNYIDADRVSIGEGQVLAILIYYSDVVLPVATDIFDLMNQLAVMLNTNQSFPPGNWVNGDATEATLQTVSTEVTSIAILNALNALSLLVGNNKDFYYAVSAGEIPNHELKIRHGKRENIDLASEFLWSGTAAYTWLTVNTTLKLSSSSVLDNPSLAGAHTVLIQGLDSGFNPISEYLVLSGQTPVNTVNQYYRVNSVDVVVAGSNRTNFGTIYLGNGAVVLGVNATPQAIIDIGTSQDSTSLYTVPRGKKLIIFGLSMNINSENISNSRPGLMGMSIRYPITGVIYKYGEAELRDYIQFGNLPLMPFAEGTDIWFTTNRLNAADNTINAYVFWSAVLSNA